MRRIEKEERLHRLLAMLAMCDDMELIDLTRKLRERRKPAPFSLLRRWTINRPDGQSVVIEEGKLATKITYLPSGKSHYERHHDIVRMLIDRAWHRGCRVYCDFLVSSGRWVPFSQLFAELNKRRQSEL